MTAFFKPLLIAVCLVAGAAPPACAGDWGGLFSAVMLTSDYRYEGVSNSRNHAALQGYLHWQRRDGWFAGVFATQDDFGYPGSPTYELDTYAGRNLELDGGRTELKLEAMYSAFPNNRTPGPTLNFFQAEAQARHVFGKWAATGSVAYVPEGSYRSGELWRIESGVDYALRPRLTFRALTGYQWGGRGHERTYWSLGLATSLKAVGFELRYVGNDRSPTNCGLSPKACAPAVVGAVTFNLPPIH